MFEIIIGILPFIIPSSVLKENFASLLLFLLGSIYIIKNKNKVKENKYFYTLFIMWILIIICQIIISPYIESISGSFLYMNMGIYYLVYGSVLRYENKDEILKYILISIAALSIFYIIYHGLYQGIRIFGNIGYANSYAVLHLVGLYLNRIRLKDKSTDIIEIILFIGLLFTGSRTTIILSLIYIVYKLYIDKKEKNIKLIYSLEPNALAIFIYITLEKLRLVSIFILPIILIFYILIKNLKYRDKIYYILGALGLIAVILSNSKTINRIKEISIADGAFQERFVYYGDSIRSILKSPIGNGINMFQYKLFENATAFYDVKYIHNSYLQVVYDTGVICFIIFIIVITVGFIKIIKSKNVNKNYLILAYLTILIHSLVDFDLSFSTFPIILVMLLVLSSIDQSKNNKTKIKNKDNEKQVFAISKYFYIVISIISIYLMIFEGTIVLGNYLIDNNAELADRIYSFSNNISFKRDYRGYFNRAQAKKDIYDKNKDNKYLQEAISLLETSKNINPYDPMVKWNLSYLYEIIGDKDKALKYGEEVLEGEKFYPGAYIKQHDYLIKLYSETADKKYEEKIKALEDYYYENYNNLNKRAKYMNNQLQENYDDIRNKNLDYNILLEGKYEKEVVYYKEEDIKDNEIDKIDSGVASMAIILSSMKEENISPIELADYYDSSVEFFQNIVKQDKYKLQVEKLEANEITKVKRLLSDGKHMAVVLIKSGELASEDNYIVLYGIETKNGVNYFLALDPNKDNIIKVKASLFLEQALGYWVYSEE